MGAAGAVVDARTAFARRDWTAALERFAVVDARGDLSPADLHLMARAAHLCGQDEVCHEALARAHGGHLDAGEPGPAVRCAFWLGMLLLDRGDQARASGWIGRASRLADELGSESPEHGYLQVPTALRALHTGDTDASLESFGRALEVGQRAGDPDLVAFGLLGTGQSLVAMGRPDQGMVLLDEVMVSVTAGEVDPIVAGIVYCAVIEACHHTWELRRAREWTGALADWCASQPDLVPYRGQCLVHRAQLLQQDGQWTEALDEVVRARDAFDRADDQVAVGAAWYGEAEVHRLRGDHEAAERAYELADRAGHSPQPGLAQLRLQDGQADVAVQALDTILASRTTDPDRAALLPALVEARLATGAVADARATVDVLADVADRLDVDWVHAATRQALGAVALAEERPSVALGHLQSAGAAWRRLGIPHEVARTRLLAARACRAAGDMDTARLEVAAARRIAVDLGARPLLDRIDDVADPDDPRAPGGLTDREVQVLAEVATGKTNREVADVLVISSKTVARHLSNIFTKLDLSSRAAATAWAYEHDVVGPSR